MQQQGPAVQIWLYLGNAEPSSVEGRTLISVITFHCSTSLQMISERKRNDRKEWLNFSLGLCGYLFSPCSLPWDLNWRLNFLGFLELISSQTDKELGRGIEEWNRSISRQFLWADCGVQGSKGRRAPASHPGLKSLLSVMTETVGSGHRSFSCQVTSRCFSS